MGSTTDSENSGSLSGRVLLQYSVHRLSSSVILESVKDCRSSKVYKQAKVDNLVSQGISNVGRNEAFLTTESLLVPL